MAYQFQEVGIYDTVNNILYDYRGNVIPLSGGSPGSVWRNGSGVPSNGLGIDGDYYLNDLNGDVYLKSSGTYSVVANILGPTGATGATGPAGSNGTNGTNGTNGVDGSVWRNGSGVPSNALGVNGDYYLDNATGDVYLKATGTYSVVTNIKGPTGATGATGPAGSNGTNGTNGTNGAPGSVWRNGSGVPSNALGIDGDYYLNDNNGDVYVKASGTYSVVANIGFNGTSVITFISDGLGNVLTTGLKGYSVVPYNCTVTGWRIISDVSGSIVIDVWNRTGSLPTVTQTIAGTEKPTLSTAQINSDLTLTTWSTTLLAGDIMAFNIDSVTSIKNIKVELIVSKV